VNGGAVHAKVAPLSVTFKALLASPAGYFGSLHDGQVKNVAEEARERLRFSRNS
jgi:hypothetical protein